jgi:hypothetical protein
LAAREWSRQELCCVGEAVKSEIGLVDCVKVGQLCFEEHLRLLQIGQGGGYQPTTAVGAECGGAESDGIAVYAEVSTAQCECTLPRFQRQM